jgi:hypothetical protein
MNRVASSNEDGVTDSDDAIGQDLGTQAAAMDEGGQNFGLCEAGEMLARLAQADAAQAHFTDLKFFIDEMVEGDTLGDDVAAGITGCQFDAGFTVNGLESFDFDQGNIATRAGTFLTYTSWTEVAVTFETEIGDGVDFFYRLGGITKLGCDVNGMDGTSKHL